MSDSWPPAFERAAQARRAIASIVDDVRDQRLDLPAAFAKADGDPLIGRVFAVKVFEVLPGIGKVRARRSMASVGLADDISLASVPAAARLEIETAFAAP